MKNERLIISHITQVFHYQTILNPKRDLNHDFKFNYDHHHHPLCELDNNSPI